MRPAKLNELYTHAPRTEQRPPAPITNLPVNAITVESDPTLEIRTLIEQLQHAAREARTRAQEAEQERDELSSRLERAFIQIDELRTTERDLRSRFTEVTAILRERDEALGAADRNARTAARAQEELAAILRQRDETQRQRDEAVRQRDETLHRIESLTRAYSESGMRSGEVQKQLGAIRQARDSAHAQIVEITNRNAGLEDQIAELEYQRDGARKAQKQAETEAAEYRRQLEQATAQHESEARQIEQLTLELDEQRKKFLDLAEEKGAVLQVGNEHAAALAEVRAQVASLAQERDAARLLEQAQGRELEKIRAQFHSFREHESQATSGELTVARERLASFEAEIREARNESQGLRRQLLDMQEKVSTLEVLVEDATAHQEEAEMQLLSTRQQTEADRAALLHARRQVEEIINERNSIRAKAEETRLELEAQVVALRTSVGGSVDLKTPAADGESDPREMQKRFERQRLQSIDLAARLEAAQQQIREMSASLAEARLQIKFAGAVSRGQAAARSTAAPAGLLGPQLGELLPAMRECFEPFAQRPEEPSLLVALHGSVVAYDERARRANCVAVHRLAQSFASLLAALAASPDQLNASTLHTIEQTIEFLAALSKDPAPERFKDPAQARVYVVDDDADNCLCVQLVMQEQMIQTAGSQDPSAALLELASESFDLIFLDINMPHMDGFELCQRLRGMSQHAKTPVVFLTGLATAEKRAQSLVSGGNDFLAKPFNLHELTVKALTLIIRAQVEV